MSLGMMIALPYKSRALHACAALGLLLLASLGSTAQAAEMEDPQRIQAIASAYAEQNAGSGRIQAQARMPDSRLNLPRCPQKPSAHASQHGLRMQVRVSCPGLWSLYVPVTVKQQKQVVVTRRSLAAGELVAAADVELRWNTLSGISYGQFESLQAVIGRKLIRPIKAGQVLQPNQLRQAFSVHKGDTVTLLSRAGPVEIRGRGKAEQNAVENSRVRVRNLSSGKIVEGYARGNGVVEIQG